MNAKRSLSLRKEVLTPLADEELGLVPGAGPAMPDSFPSLCDFTCLTCDRTCLTCDWTCLCVNH